MSAKHQKIVLNLPGYSAEEREAIALEAIDRIVARTKQGVDKKGQPFAKYSKTYTQSLDFQNAGKSKGEVNLTLSGDMLDSIRILKNAAGKVEIGFERGSAENGKADGNIRGTYGQDKKVGPKRDFLGLSSRELDKILAKYPPETKKSEQRAARVLTTNENAERLSGRVDVDDLED